MTDPRVMVPVLTPVNGSGRVDAGACAAYAELAEASWLDLFLVSGTIGAGESSTVADRRRVLELWAARVSRDRLLGCVWTAEDLAHASDLGVRPIVVLRGIADDNALLRRLGELPGGAFVYSHPKYTNATFTPVVAEAAQRSGVRPSGGKICKVNLDEVRQLRRATGESFQLFDGRCRYVAQSVQAGATGVVAVPLCTLPHDLPGRSDTAKLQQVIDRAQARIDAVAGLDGRVAMLTEDLMSRLTA